MHVKQRPAALATGPSSWPAADTYGPRTPPTRSDRRTVADHQLAVTTRGTTTMQITHVNIAPAAGATTDRLAGAPVLFSHAGDGELFTLGDQNLGSEAGFASVAEATRAMRSFTHGSSIGVAALMAHDGRIVARAVFDDGQPLAIETPDDWLGGIIADGTVSVVHPDLRALVDGRQAIAADGTW